MNRKPVRRLAPFAFLTLLALGTFACNTGVGVGVAAPVQGGWASRPGGYAIGGVYVGGGPTFP